MPRNELICYFFETMVRNKEFLNKNVKGLLRMSVDLVNDAMDYTSLFLFKEGPNGEKVEREDSIDLLKGRAMAFYVIHILMPVSYAIYYNLLGGMLTTCFRELRFAVESLAKCYLADAKYPDKSFYEEKLEALSKEEKVIKGKCKKKVKVKKREHDLIEEFDREMCFEGKTSRRLWGKLSEEIHTTGYVKRVVDTIINEMALPSYALGTVEYDKSDLKNIKDFYDYLYDFRGIVKKTMGKYRKSYL
ncbi:MAG: hypothetical protein ACTSR0_06390 [Candidatus Asgardarchaeia archaeon]